MTWRRALDSIALAAGVALLVFGLASNNSSDIWVGAVITASSVLRIAVPGYKFDPRKSAIQQWRDRRRS